MLPLPPLAAQGGQGGQQVVYIYQYGAPPKPESGPPRSCCSGFFYYASKAAVAFFLWAGWAIYIAGTARAQQKCNVDGMSQAPFTDMMVLSAQGIAPAGDGQAKYCVYYFALQWFSVFLQFSTILVATVTTFAMAKTTCTAKGVLNMSLYFAVASAVLMFIIADKYNVGLYINLNELQTASHDWTIACTLTLVGVIVSMVFNFIYIMWNAFNDPARGAPGVPGLTAPTPAVDAYVAPEATKTKAVAAAATSAAAVATTSTPSTPARAPAATVAAAPLPPHILATAALAGPATTSSVVLPTVPASTAAPASPAPAASPQLIQLQSIPSSPAQSPQVAASPSTRGSKTVLEPKVSIPFQLG